MNLKTMLIFSITFLLTLVRQATEREIPPVNDSPSFYLRVHYAESVYFAVTSHDRDPLGFIGSMNVRKSFGPYSVSPI